MVALDSSNAVPPELGVAHHVRPRCTAGERQEDTYSYTAIRKTAVIGCIGVVVNWGIYTFQNPTLDDVDH